MLSQEGTYSNRNLIWFIDQNLINYMDLVNSEYVVTPRNNSVVDKSEWGKDR